MHNKRLLTETFDKDRFYINIEGNVNDCLDELGLREFCVDSYDNSYDTGTEDYYEIQWNFTEVPDVGKAEEELNKTLQTYGSRYGIDICEAKFDTETLEDEGFINLTIAWEIPYDFFYESASGNKNASVVDEFKLYENMWEADTITLKEGW